MHSKPQALPLILLAAAAGDVVLCDLAPLQLDDEGKVPEWIVLFPETGNITTRDGRNYVVDPETLIAAFRADGLYLPLDVNHSNDTAASIGERSDAFGWITELKAEGNALMGRVDWLPEGSALVSSKRYRYTSPAFYADKAGKAVRLKGASLVNSPALARQPALASARQSSEPSEPSMKTIAVALGLTEDANEAACLASLNARLQGSVAKDVHDATLAQLQSTSTELQTLKADGRKKRVDDLIEGALKAKKILPAEKDHYTSLCATDDGFASVEKLFAAKTPLLTQSGLDDRQAPEGGAHTLSATDASVIAAMGLTEEAYRKALAG